METWSFYSAGIRIARFWPAAGTLEWACLDDGTGVLGARGAMNEENAEWFARRYQFSPAAFFEGLSAWNEAFAGGGSPVSCGGSRYDRRPDGFYAQREARFPKDILFADGAVRAQLCSNGNGTTVLVQDGWEARTPAGAWLAYAPAEPACPVRALGTFMVPARDGVRLATDVYVPGNAQGPVPVMLVRTPYDKTAAPWNYFNFVRRGYALAVQDVRGRSASEGDFLPCYHEVEDGDDTLNWIAGQEWSNGRVGMIGGSYLGYVQWCAAASGNPHLQALVSMVTAGSAFADIPRRGGCFESGMMAWAFAVSNHQMDAARMVRDDWDDVLQIRPLESMAREAIGEDIHFLNTWFEHPDNDELWQMSDWQARSKGARIPALIFSGWFDDDGMGTTQALELVHDWPAVQRKAVLGPWIHSFNSRYDIHGVPMGLQAIRYDVDLLYFQWVDHFLRDVENGVEKGAPVEYFTIGEDKWKTAENWPVAAARPQTLYLDGEAGAAVENHGLLALSVPGADASDTYRYDPDDPAVNIIDMSENEIEVPEDYAAEELRPDVLCYTTPPLATDAVITGDCSVELFISSDAEDTDFIVRVTEATPDGKSIKLADGVLCAKYREGFEAPRYLQPGAVYPIHIRTTKFSKRFEKGSRLRVTVTSSAKNFLFPNSNTRAGFNSAETVVAHNTIHHGPAHPSAITLNVEKALEF